MRALEIAGPREAVQVARDGVGSARFVLVNLTSSVIQVQLQVLPHDPHDFASFKIEGGAVQNLGAKEEKKVSVSIQMAKPETASPDAATSHTFTLKAVDLDSVDSAIQTSPVEVLASTREGNPSWGPALWVLVPLLMLLGALIGVAIGYAYHRRHHLPSPATVTTQICGTPEPTNMRNR